jgi:hypothetical protein
MEALKAESSNAKQQILLPTKPCELRLWLADQITILAEAFGCELTAARLRVYVEDLSALPQAQLEIALTRARRELRFFPKIAELREFAGAKAEDIRSVEAEAAWKFASDYLRKWGVERLPFYSGGKRLDAPALPSRIEYALRRIGGLRGLNQVTEQSRPFVFKDFVEAFHLAPMAESLAPQFLLRAEERKGLPGNDCAKTQSPTEVGTA